ncbi:MAG: DUF4249 family protein [Bacteriovoracaceae bacterium]|nr:DUF4249 domain-containing protein [Bacteroidota bacterium]
MKSFSILIFALVFVSCNDDFSPNGKYIPKLIVYSVLDAASDTQYVRVYSSFSPEQYVPDTQSPNTEITNAVVRVYDDSSEFIFTDTLVTVTVGNVAKNIHVFMHAKFKPKERKLYHLSVQSGEYPATTSTATGIEFAQIIITDTKPLSVPEPGKNVTFDVYLGRNTGAYLAVMRVEFEVLRNGKWTVYSMEVPLDIVTDESGKVSKSYYPIPVLYRSKSAPDRFIPVNFSTEVYSATIRRIKEEFLTDYETKNLRFKDVRFILTQFDNDIFTYYSVANNFPGATTIRLDEPDFTNMKNGYGIFGSISTQVKVYGIPSDFP